MKAAKTVPPRKTPALLAPVLLAILLIVLFWKSFVPAYVHFSNDGPLGQEMSHYLRLPAAMLGSWNDLNGIGMNASATAPDVSAFLHWALGPVSYSKFYAPISLFILGLGAWTFFRQLRLSRLAAILGSLAAVLGSAWFSTACWGDASQQIAAGMCFFALALVASNSSESSAIVRGLRLVLAGFAVGVNVMEAADIGAIYSLFVAAFIFVMAIVDNDAPAWLRAGRGIFRVVVIAVFAALIAAQSIFALIQFAIVGVVGMQGSGASKADQVAHWDYATQWSLPKVETLGIFVPGLFGYRMDTPENAPWLPDHSYDAGEYWGAVGRAPAWDRYFASGENGPPPSGGVAGLRFSGGGEYAGILVALIAIWAIAQSLRRQGSIFSLPHRRLIWFLTGVCICSILLAWGRFAPFYQIFYAVPYLGSEIRNPAKFINIFTFAFVTAFAVGVDGLDRRYLGVPAVNIKSTISRLQSWWTNVRGFDRKWTAGCGIALGVCVLGWFVYVAEKPALVAYLQTVGFSNDPRAGVPASQIAAFSISQAAWFLLFLAAAIFLFILIISGVFAGNRARLGGILLGGLLVIDLARGNAPWIVYWNYPLKYQSNPIVNFLRQKPWEHRVLNLPFASGPLPSTPEYENDPYWGQLYAIEWIQQLFPFYNIQSLDYVQNPRAATDLAAFDETFMPNSASPDSLRRLCRSWELSNVRYLLGPMTLPGSGGEAISTLSLLNGEMDPIKKRFRVAARFDIVPKEALAHQLEDLTIATNEAGGCALFEFTGALPRAKLYSHWETNSAETLKSFSTKDLSPNEAGILNNFGTNDLLILKKLASPAFDPWQTVLVPHSLPPPSDSTNENAGTVTFKSYSPEKIVFSTDSTLPTVLLFNDKYDPHWHAFVDGRSAPLFRANFIMQGVYLPAGRHRIEFSFTLPSRPLDITLSSVCALPILGGLLILLTRKPKSEK